MVDPKTVAAYDQNAARYSSQFDSAAPDDDLAAFMASVRPGGHVLDVGCGTGAASAHMLAAGLTVDAFDASAEMVRLATDRGVGAVQAQFGDISAKDRYDGVWANFSLLHADRADMPGILARLHLALVPGGRLHIGLKTGTGVLRDALGRMYTYYTSDELAGLLEDAGFTLDSTRTGSSIGLDGAKAPFVIVTAHG